MFRIVYIFILGWLSAIAHAGTITGFDQSVLPDRTHSELVIKGTDLPKPSVFEIAEGNRRVVIDFSDTATEIKTDTVKNGQMHIPGKFGVTSFRQAVRGENGLRIVLDVKPGVTLLSSQSGDNQVRIVLFDPAADIRRPVPSKPRYFKGKIPYPMLKPYVSHAVRQPPVIVIDPGHGGKDPGAVGQAGTREKSVTLSAAKELKALLEKSGKYTVVLTRADDRYIDHDERIKIARLKQADLFISLHADSTSSSNTRGASVYTLADRARGRSKGIVNSQNWIMDVDLAAQSDPVGDILVDLAQRKTFSQSSEFADQLLVQLSKSTHMVRNSHRRAGYYVLLAPDVPAVLLELGFISNKTDEKLLKSKSHRKKVLKSVVTAIDKYFDAQNR